MAAIIAVGAGVLAGATALYIRVRRRGHTTRDSDAELLFTSLPRNILEHIVSLLPSAEDIARVDCVATVFHSLPPPPELQQSIIQQALMMRLPFVLRDGRGGHICQPAQPGSALTQFLLQEEVTRRKFYFAGKLKGKSEQDEDDENDEYVPFEGDPFEDYPRIHGHLNVPLTWEGEVTGLYTVDDSPHDDGMGPLVFGIRGRIEANGFPPCTHYGQGVIKGGPALTLSFEYNNTSDPSDDDGIQAEDVTVTGTNGSGILIQVLRYGGRATRKCTLHGSFQLSDWNGSARGSAKLTLATVPRRHLEAMRGRWSKSWRGEDEICDGDVFDGARAVRLGPHPSLYPSAQLAQLGHCDGFDVTILGPWPFTPRARQPHELLHRLEDAEQSERVWREESAKGELARDALLSWLDASTPRAIWVDNTWVNPRP